jgi:hypothetical protein
MFLADYNLDGKNDLFTYGIGGVKVYRNSGNSGVGLQWVLEKNLLYSDYNGMFMGLYVSSADIPAIVDVDGDSDLDILTFSIAGDHVEYHKNMSKELYGHCDSLIYVLKNKCWGGFREEVTSNTITLFDPGILCTSGNVPNPQLPVITKPEEEEKAHAGSTLLALDLDNSGVLDLLIGDVAYGNLNKLMNGGRNAWEKGDANGRGPPPPAPMPNGFGAPLNWLKPRENGFMRLSPVWNSPRSGSRRARPRPADRSP